MKWLTNLVMPNWLRFVLMYVLPLAILIGIVYAIYNFGVTVEHDRNVATENKELATASQKNFELQTKVREDEKNHVKKVNELTINYEKRINDAETKTKSALHAVATGAIKLRIATKNNTTICTSGASAVSTAASQTNETSAELSTEAAGFLINLTSECDATAEKLNLCIDIAESDRRLTTSQISSEMTTSTELTNKEISNEK